MVSEIFWMNIDALHCYYGKHGASVIYSILSAGSLLKNYSFRSCKYARPCVSKAEHITPVKKKLL